MRARKFGRIISISSINGQKGQWRALLREGDRLHQGAGNWPFWPLIDEIEMMRPKLAGAHCPRTPGASY